MAENLWEIRRRKKMKVRDLAAKSGVPASLIHQYEAGEKPISQSHLRQFARALIVETWEIKLVSDPSPVRRRGPESQSRLANRVLLASPGQLVHRRPLARPSWSIYCAWPSDSPTSTRLASRPKPVNLLKI